MRLRNMFKICLVFWKSEPQYAYKHYAYKKNMYGFKLCMWRAEIIDSIVKLLCENIKGTYLY